MAKVRYKFGFQDEYDSLAIKDNNSLYFLLDSQRIYKGEYKIASSDVIFTKTVPSIDHMYDDKLYMVLHDDKYYIYVKNGDKVTNMDLGVTSLTDVDCTESEDTNEIIWSFKLSDGTKKEFTLPKDKFLSNASINEDKSLVLTLSNGDEITVDMATLIDDTDTIKLAEDIEPVGIELYGGIPATGWKKDTPITEVLKSLLQKEQDAIVKEPSMQIYMSGSVNSVEAGLIVNPIIGVTFDKGSYEPGLPKDTGVKLTSYSLFRNGSDGTRLCVYQSSTESNYTELQGVQIGDTETSYVAEYSYSNGNTPTTNMGNKSVSIAILGRSGVQTNSVSISGYRKYFYGSTSNKPEELASDNIRSLKSSLGGYAKGDFTMKVTIGSQRVLIACPASKPGVVKIINESALNADMTKLFKSQKVLVEGANGYTPIEYNVWTYEPAVPYTREAVLSVTLG